MAESLCMTCLRPAAECECGDELTRHWIRKLSTSHKRKLMRLLADELERDLVMDNVVAVVHAKLTADEAGALKELMEQIDNFESLPDHDDTDYFTGGAA